MKRHVSSFFLKTSPKTFGPHCIYIYIYLFIYLYSFSRFIAKNETNCTYLNNLVHVNSSNLCNTLYMHDNRGTRCIYINTQSCSWKYVNTLYHHGNTGSLCVYVSTVVLIATLQHSVYSWQSWETLCIHKHIFLFVAILQYSAYIRTPGTLCIYVSK